MPAAEHLQETLTWIHNDTSLPTETTELWKKDHLSEGCLNRELPLARSRTSGPLYSHFRYISGHLQFAWMTFVFCNLNSLYLSKLRCPAHSTWEIMKKDRKAPHEEYYSLSWFLNVLQNFAYVGNLRRETVFKWTMVLTSHKHKAYISTKYWVHRSAFLSIRWPPS